ncbi:Gfo/Idh/MocA family oxidoreductase [Streptomyces albidochromogenes]|uniref:Gfo/Idh/MocA family protein n=1 Tax=Streptomyces albidochromogenes TaxID=329524 RepID=UPI00110F8A0B|nr:Gfo/Idh/MocA family oxidoreductase [Streptomyces albidochromogenes]
MPERPVRWGILATGPMAAAFTEDLATVPEAEVLAVGSRSERSAAVFADRHAIPRAYGGWQDLAADPDIDVVYVATPHAHHAAATAACLSGGKAVLCEKPFALNRAQAAAMAELAERESLFLMEAMWTYLNPLIQQVCSLIDDGVIGEVRSVHADFGVRAPHVPGHRLRDPAAGGGALLDLGTYPVSFAHLLLGPARHVAAWSDLSGAGVDESTAMVLGHDNGAMAVLSCSLTADSARGAVVHGSEGRIEFPADFYNPRTAILRRDGQAARTLVADPQTGHGYDHQAREVMRCLREKRTESPLVPLRGTLDVMETLDRVRALVGLRFPGE